MTPQTITTDFGFPSTDGRSNIHGIIWQPVGQKPVAVVQIIHGMAEHIERYEPFARYLAERGFIVCGHDHIGHGRSSVKEDLGHMPSKNGAEILVEDCGLETLLRFFEQNGAEAVVLGCTHFPYVKAALQRRTDLPVLDPSERLAELVLGR